MFKALNPLIRNKLITVTTLTALTTLAMADTDITTTSTSPLIPATIHTTIPTTATSTAASAKPSAEKHTHEFLFANGLKLIVRENHRAPVAMFQIWYKIGSSYEPNGLTGISHVLEHMMFKGTDRLAPGQFSELVAKYGGSENAFTSRDYTGYYQFWEKSRLPLSFELEAERMTQIKFDAEEFKKELLVVIEERRMRVEDNPNAIAHERFNAAAYASSPYRQPIIGWSHDLPTLTVEDAERWYQQWYAPNNAIIVVVGDVDPNEVYELTERYFGQIPPKDLPKTFSPTEIEPLGERRIEVISEKAKLPTLILGFNVPTLGSTPKSQGTPATPYILKMLAGVIDGGYSARVETDLIRRQKLAASAGTGYNMYSRGDGLFSFSAIPNQGVSIHTLEEALHELIQEIKDSPPSEEELKRIRAQLISNLVYEQDSLSTQAYTIGSLESIGLSWKTQDLAIEALKKVTPEQIQAAAQQYLTKDRLTVGVLKPAMQESQNKSQKKRPPGPPTPSTALPKPE